ncbi:MAG: hypothetical protein IT184_05785 [Acidobacteria bacterium]|nr:hypothetical protein [Acidobacteriota bacterium]
MLDPTRGTTWRTVLLLAGLTLGAAEAAAQSQPHEMTAPETAERQYPSLRFSGFGDVNLSGMRRTEGARGFSLGQLALHMASELSPRVTFFGELSFTARADAGTGSPAATGFNTEVERMILRFDQSDRLKVSFGRYHTPINYWNTAFHHGQWLQTTIARPEMVQFGGRFLPVHFIGALVEGAVPARGMNLSYKGGVGNGRASAISRGGDAGDVNGQRAWLVNVFSKPDRFYGLEVGAAAYGDRITLADAREFSEQIVAAHVAWQKEEPELIAEIASVRHTAVGGASSTWNHAYYVQGAYRLPQFERLWKPYARFEHVGIDAADAVFATVPRLDGLTLGVRYDASSLAAIKGEYRTWTRGADSVRNHGGFFQVCFTF